MRNIRQNCQKGPLDVAAKTGPGARCPFSISIEPPSPHSSATASPHYEQGSSGDQSPKFQGSKGGASFNSDSDDGVDASVLCPHYDEHHKGKHYKQFLRQKAAEAQAIKETARPPLWRVPIVRQPLPVSVEEFNSAEPQYAKFVKALWSHARTTVEDKEAAEDFAQSPMGQGKVPERCRELDQAGWRRGALMEHCWEDRPGAVGRPLSPTIIRQGPSWLVDAEGYDGPYGSAGDLRSKGMAYESRFQLPTLSSLMKAKHAVFVKAKDPRKARIASQRQTASARRSRQPQRLGAGRCQSSPPQLKSPTDPSESRPLQQQQHQLTPAALTPSFLKPPSPPVSPDSSMRKGQHGSPRGSMPRSPRTSAPSSPAGSPRRRTTEIRSPKSPLSGQKKNESAGESSWTVQIRGKGKYQYPLSYIRWKRERRRMRERLRRLRAGEIFTSDRPNESCTDCENPNLCWDPQPLTEHLHAVRSFGSAPEDDASSGTDISSSSDGSSSTGTSNSGSSSRSCSSSREDEGTQQYRLRTAACANSSPSSPFTPSGAGVVPPPPALYPFAGALSGVAVGSYLHTPSGLPYTPVLPGLLQTSQGNLSPGVPLRSSGSIQQQAPWLVPRHNIAGAALTLTQPGIALPALQHQHTLLGRQHVQQGQLLGHQLQQLQQTLLHQPIQRSCLAVQFPGTGAMYQTVAVQPSQSVCFEHQQRQQRQEYGMQQEEQKQQKDFTSEYPQKRGRLLPTGQDGVVNSREVRDGWNIREASISRSRQHYDSNKTHARYRSEPPPARPRPGISYQDPLLASNASAPQRILSSAAIPATQGGWNVLDQAPPQAMLTQPLTQPMVNTPSQLVFGNPQLVSTGSTVVQVVPQLVQEPPNVLKGTLQMVQGATVPAVLSGSPSLVSAGTQQTSRTRQQVHPGHPWVLCGAGGLQRQQHLEPAATSQRSASCSPTGLSVVGAPLPLLPPQQTPIVVGQLRQQPVLVPQPQQLSNRIQQQQAVVINKQGQPVVVQWQQQQPLVIQQQQQKPLVIQMQQQPPQSGTMHQKQQSPQQNATRLPQQPPTATIVIQQQQPPIVTLEEQKPATKSTPEEKPKTQWLWSCNIDCGAQCDGGSHSTSRGSRQKQHPPQPHPRQKHQPPQRLLRTQEAEPAPPEDASTEAHPSLIPTAAAVPLAESRQCATAHQLCHTPKLPSGSDGTKEALQDPSQACMYLQPLQQQLHPVSPRRPQGPQQQHKLRTPTALSTSSPIPFASASPVTQNIFASSRPLQSQIYQQQQPPREYRQSPCCQPHREENAAQREPPFKYLPFTFISAKRNIACGMGKRTSLKEPPAAVSPRIQQLQQTPDPCGTTGCELSAGVSCSI